jgi:hypothetical protein
MSERRGPKIGSHFKKKWDRRWQDAYPDDAHIKAWAESALRDLGLTVDDVKELAKKYTIKPKRRTA